MAPGAEGKEGGPLPSSLEARIEAIHSNEKNIDAAAFQKAVERRAKVSFSVAIAGVGTSTFLLAAYVMCTSGIADPELTAEFHSKADRNAYAWPMVAFGTAFSLNFITLMFERESAKFQLALLACYINFLAGFSDYLAYIGVSPIIRDGWGQGFQVVRVVMWLYTTPAMVYLLSIISDFSRTKVYVVMLSDICMISFGLLAFMATNKAMSILLYLFALAFFCHVISSMWSMVNAPIAEARHDSSRLSLEILRLFAVGLWFTFPSIWLMVKTGLMDIETEEWVWCWCDFLGKVMFSSSLLHGNFLTIEQRRLIAMRIVEEGNRIQVIQELKDLVEQKERFMSSMSHELRTPLNGIIGLSDALLVGSCGDINDQAQKTITTIKTSGSRLLNLINDILDAASMKKGKLTIKHEKVNLRRVVDDVIDLCQPLAKRGVKLVNDLKEGQMPYVLGDTGRIIQIFHNLIGNSCKFTHQGYISVGTELRGDEVVVAVSDTGIGIPEDKFEQIFLAFEQVDMSITRKYGGTGLGLSLVKQLVEAHGGSITVKSKEGLGTTFFFSLKLYNESPNEGQSQMAPADPVTAPAEHHQLAAVKAASQAEGHPGPRRAPSRRGSFNDKGLLAAVKRSSTVSDMGKSMGSSLGPGQAQAAQQQAGGATGGGGGGGGAAGGDGGAGGPSAGNTGGGGGGGAGQEGSMGRLSHTSASLAPGVHSVASGPQVSGPMSLSDAAAMMKGALKRKSSFREKGQKVRVLSVDDDPVNQLVIQNLLAPVGYEIIQAMDGQEALKVLTEEERLPDVILLDVMMPGMSGYEVCRKLREMYPLSCIPVIMISAKSKEEHIVEGLAAGSNDYVVKPFGRQEILARIAAHLRFRDTVYQAGELAGAIPGEVLPGRVLLRGGSGGAHDLAPFLTGPAMFPSLPPGVKSSVETGTAATTLQMFDQLTLLEVSLRNLSDLLVSVPSADLLVGLASLYHDLDTLLQQHGCYLLERLDDQLIIVSGLDLVGDQVLHALGLARSLLAAAANTAVGPRGAKLQLAIGLHTGPTQGVLVGHAHPVLQFVGQMPLELHMLQATCPTGCVHVSNRVLESASSERDQFVAAGTMQNGTTYLLKAGQWDQGGALQANENTTKWARGVLGLHSGINMDAKRMRPIQLAMMAMVQVNPGFLVDIAGVGPMDQPAHARKDGGLSAKQSSSGAAGVGGGGGEAEAVLVAKLCHERDLLEQQLEEVSNEASRLQDIVDELEAQLLSAKGAASAGAAEAADAAVAAASAESEAAKSHALSLEHQLMASVTERNNLEAALHELQQRLMSMQAALAAANHEAADRERMRSPSVLPSGAAPGDMQRMDMTSEGGSQMYQVSGAQSASGGMGVLERALMARQPMPMALGIARTPLPNLSALRAQAGDIRGLLEELGLGGLASRFESEDVTPALLPFLDEAAMRELGATSVGARLRLRLAAQALYM